MRKLYEVVKQDKVCKSCEVEKPYTEYNRCKYTKGGLKHKCRDCMTDYSRSYAKVNKERHKEAPKSKQCKECGEVKDIHKFPKDHSSRDGYKNICNNCRSLKQREYVKNNRDKVRDQKKRDYEKNRDRYREYRREYYVENKEDILEKRRIYYYSNQEKILEYNRKYCRDNIEKRSANAAERNLRLKTQQPPWVEDFKDDIKEIYKERQKLDNETGNQHHVDHIIPLTNDEVCGLHVYWNMQILTREENCSKGNKFDGTYNNDSWR